MWPFCVDARWVAEIVEITAQWMECWQGLKKTFLCCCAALECNNLACPGTRGTASKMAVVPFWPHNGNSSLSLNKCFSCSEIHNSRVSLQADHTCPHQYKCVLLPCIWRPSQPKGLRHALHTFRSSGVSRSGPFFSWRRARTNRSRPQYKATLKMRDSDTLTVHCIRCTVCACLVTDDTQHNTTQYNTTQHNTTQHKVAVPPNTFSMPCTCRFARDC